MAFFKINTDSGCAYVSLEDITVLVVNEVGNSSISLKSGRDLYILREEAKRVERLLDVANRKQAEMSHSLREAYSFVTLKDGTILQEAREAYANQPKVFINPNLTRRSPAEAPKEPPVQDLPGSVWKSYLVLDPSDVVKCRIVNDWGTMGKGSPPWKIEAKDAEKDESPEAKAALDAVINDPAVWVLCSQESHVTGACSDCDKLTVLRGWNNLAKGRRDLCRECEAKLFGGPVGKGGEP